MFSLDNKRIQSSPPDFFKQTNTRLRLDVVVLDKKPPLMLSTLLTEFSTYRNGETIIRYEHICVDIAHAELQQKFGKGRS